MFDPTQFVTDPALCAQLQSFDPTKLVGLAGAPAIEQAVQYLKEQWGISTKLAPLFSVGLGIALNVGLALYLGLGLGEAVGIGAMTGFLASGWHVVSH